MGVDRWGKTGDGLQLTSFGRKPPPDFEGFWRFWKLSRAAENPLPPFGEGRNEQKLSGKEKFSNFERQKNRGENSRFFKILTKKPFIIRIQIKHVCCLQRVQIHCLCEVGCSFPWGLTRLEWLAIRLQTRWKPPPDFWGGNAAPGGSKFTPRSCTPPPATPLPPGAHLALRKALVRAHMKAGIKTRDKNPGQTGSKGATDDNQDVVKRCMNKDFRWFSKPEYLCETQQRATFISTPL